MMSAARRRTLVAAATAAVLAVVILCLAVPRLIGAALLAPGNVPLQLIQSERESSPEGYARIVESRSAALPWMESGRLLTDRALGRQLLARSEADGEPLKPEVLEPIIADLELPSKVLARLRAE